MVRRVLIGPNTLRVSRPGVDVSETTPQADLIFDPLNNRYNGSLHSGTVLYTDIPLTATGPAGGYSSGLFVYSKFVPFGVTYAEVPRVIWGVYSPFFGDGNIFMERYSSAAVSSGPWRCSVSTELTVARNGITCTTRLVYTQDVPRHARPEFRWNYRYVVFII